MGTLLYVTNCFPLATFNIFSLSLSFGIFFFSFFLPVCMSVCFVFSAGSRRGVLVCSNFPPKTWAGGRLCDPPLGRRSKAWAEIFLIPDTRTGRPNMDTQRKGEREKRGSGLPLPTPTPAPPASQLLVSPIPDLSSPAG